MRANSLTNLGVALDYNVTSDYDKVLALSGVASEIEALAPYATEIANIVANLPDVLTVQEAVAIINNLTVSVTTLPAGSTATSELVGTEIRLGVPAGVQGVQGVQGPKGDKGDKGDIGLTGAQGPVGPIGPQGPRGLNGANGEDGVGVTITSVLNNVDKSLTIIFSDGTLHTTNPIKGEDGRSVTITNVINNANGTMLINFSDGTSHHTADLRGPQGLKGEAGDRVHHISYQRSKDPLGNEVGPVGPGHPGYGDTYAMWMSQEELPETYIGEFTVHNGLNTLTAEEQAKFDSIEWAATADQVASEVPFSNTATGMAAENVQTAIVELNTEKEDKANKGQPGGYAGLALDGKVDISQMPTYVTSVAGKTGVVTLGKVDVGLWDVDNTSDLNKPVSTATQTALNGKQATLVSGTNIKTIEGQSLVGSGNIDLTKSDVGLSSVDNTADSAKNVLSATKWTTARTITLSGDVSGSASVDGSANVTITTAVQPNSVALGTDTTGNYVAGITQGTGITISGTAGEGWSPTVAITNVGTAGTYTKVTTNAQGQVTSGGALTATDIPALDASKITTGIIDATRLPAYVDDVLEFANQASFPATGESGKIYVALDTNKTYRWSGSAYVYITSGAVDSVNGQTGVVNVTTVTGNAGTATALQTARLIGGVSFNGTSDIALPGVNATGNQNTTGNAATATKLQTSRTISLSGDVTGSVSFDGSANASITAVVADDSHNHIISNVDGLQVGLDSKVGKVTSTDNAVVRFNGTTGNIQDSGVIINDNDIKLLNTIHNLVEKMTPIQRRKLYRWMEDNIL